jgi:hypothetical protein
MTGEAVAQPHANSNQARALLDLAITLNDDLNEKRQRLSAQAYRSLAAERISGIARLHPDFPCLITLVATTDLLQQINEGANPIEVEPQKTKDKNLQETYLGSLAVIASGTQTRAIGKINRRLVAVEPGTGRQSIIDTFLRHKAGLDRGGRQE